MNCISCGMPMRTAEEHAGGDASKTYCKHCSTAGGAMKSYAEVLSGLTAFLERTQGLDGQVAGETAKKMLAGTPAWSGR